MSDPITRLNDALAGRYRIGRELGEGGMATVYLADDIRHERKVALKVLKPELAAVVGAERFLAEIKTTANLHHPHILPLFDSGEAGGFLFYVMPYVDGETLRDRVERERQLPVDEAIAIAKAVASALQHAHERGVIHRDIKPANILLQDGQPVVSDFGIALAVGAAGGTRLTETGLSVGTPYYMSPEQATGDQVVGPSSDTFALACVLYEMLVGEPPYPGSTAQAVLGKIIQGAPVSAKAVRTSVPEHVDAAIRKALEKLPADRFTEAADFARALSDPAFRHGTAAAGTGSGGSGWTALTTVFAALTLVFGLTAVWALVSGADAPTAVERYGSPFLESQAPAGTGPGNFRLAPDGSSVVYVGPIGGQGSGVIQLWLRRWSDLVGTPIRGTEGGDQPALSPDGTEVAFHRSDQIHVTAVEGGPVRTLTRGQWPQWDGAGNIYAMLGAVGIVRVPATGGAPDTVAVLGENDTNLVVFDVLPGDETGLVWAVLANNSFELRSIDLESGEMRVLGPGAAPQYVESGHVVYGLDGAMLAAPFDIGRAEFTGPAVSVESDINFVSVSRTGRLLYSTGTEGGADRQLMWLTRSGEATPIDSAWVFTRGDVNTGWSLSPDGSRIALRELTEGLYDIWIKQLDDGPRSRLTFDDAFDVAPQWSPDGERVLYVSGPATAMEVFSRRADGTGEPEQVVDIEQSVALAQWTPDREWLILRTTTGAGNVFGRDIYAIRPGTDTEPRPLIAADFDETDPAISPDGRWIAYASNETGRYEVYVRPFPDVDSGRWQISTGGGLSPKWAHSGRELFFRDGNYNMSVAEVDGSGSALRASSPGVLFPIPPGYEGRTQDISFPYEVSGDDQRLILARIVRDETEEEGGLPDFILVQNFIEELKARVPR